MTTPAAPAAPAPPSLRWGAWGVAVAAALAVPALAALPPFVPGALRGVLMAAFDPLCHQLRERSFAVGGIPFALCHRCYGVALGLALGVLLAPGVLRRRPGASADGRPGLLLLALAALPMGADWGLDVLGVWANGPASRMATGLAFGLVAGGLLGDAVARRPPARPLPGPDAPG
jgi:uncharacterized membrane protein